MRQIVLLAAAFVVGCTHNFTARRGGSVLTWRVAAINGHTTPSRADYWMEFRGSRVGGRFGCNHFSGQYDTIGKTMIVGPVSATEMVCADPAGSFERWGFAVLQQHMTMTWSGDRLTLSNPSGQIDLTRSY